MSAGGEGTQCTRKAIAFEGDGDSWKLNCDRILHRWWPSSGKGLTTAGVAGSSTGGVQQDPGFRLELDLAREAAQNATELTLLPQLSRVRRPGQEKARAPALPPPQLGEAGGARQIDNARI